jgi:hypothetical protein
MMPFDLYHQSFYVSSVFSGDIRYQAGHASQPRASTPKALATLTSWIMSDRNQANADQGERVAALELTLMRSSSLIDCAVEVKAGGCVYPGSQ